MICCTLGALLIAPVLTWMRKPWRAASGLAFVAALPALFLFATGHLDHYAARARANERTLIAEIMAQPLCTGGLAMAKASSSNLPRGEGG